MIPFQNNVRKYRTKGHDKVYIYNDKKSRIGN